jgi:CheY-like chemotaxis protein
VDEVLDISKVESERLYFEQMPFSLVNLMDDVTTLLRRLAAQKNLTFNINTSGLKPGRIISDPTRLRQILINVIGNAIKFTAKGSINVEVNLREVPNLSPTKLMLEIVVRDTGIGISPAQAAQLFQPFTQADSSMARRFGGTGLGLFLSRKMARLLGGDLVLRRSEPSQGSEFVLTILVEPQAVAPTEVQVKEAEAATAKKSDLSGKVLVVDDSIDNREWMQYACEHLGLTIDTAESGEEGVKKALRNGYDAILMDIQMPEMDGFAAVRALQLSQYKGPVIAVTAHAMKGDRENCLNKGFDDYLCKPLSRQSLEDCLRKHIRLSS